MGLLTMATDLDKLHDICNKTYKEQAVWFLNCFWQDFAEKEAELIWGYVQKNNELDADNHEEGCGLDEMKAHVFLEKFDETLTVREMRAKLRSTGAIGESERPKTVPLTHYLLYKYNANWHTLVDESRQGDNKEEMAKAEALLEQVLAAFKESEDRAADARNALNAAVSAENSAKAREAEAVESENQAVARENDAKASEEKAKQREASAKESAAQAKQRESVAKKDAAAAVERENEAKAAQSELEEALAALHAEEKAYNDKKAELERKSTEGGVVSMNKAKNELAQHLAEDPLPLRRAKITAEAAVKRAEKTSKASADARQSAEASAEAASKARPEAEAAAKEAAQARATAEQARQASEDAKQAADKALDDASKKLTEAEEYLAEVKSKPGCANGQLWWIDRELHEQRKYLPVRRVGIAK